jgi:mono/diheme cytochrome c family protein
VFRAKLGKGDASVNQLKVLSALLIGCLLFVAACAKQSNTSTSTSGEYGAAATSAATESSKGGQLPIPLAKLPNAKVAKGDTAAGAKVFSANCESCHGAGGKNGQVGPTLYGMGFKAGQVAYMVKNPQGVDKSSGMPKLPLTDKQIADVSAYVASLK